MRETDLLTTTSFYFFQNTRLKIMITVALDESTRLPLYEQLYRHIRLAIEGGTLKAGEKLPSKRKMADHLRVSLRTIENAYAQLAVEGYVEAVEKKAYYVRQLEQIVPGRIAAAPALKKADEQSERYLFDLKTNKVSMADFPFSIWTRLMRESLRNRDTSWLEPSHPQGNQALRQEIVHYLRQFRNMDVSVDQVILGAGSEYLLGLITELLPASTFGLEEPNYPKPAKILHSRKVLYEAFPMDDEGIRIDELRNSRTSVVLVTPSHHFPLGTVMSVSRRMQLLQWAASADDRYLIEDDYDSEFRFSLKPIPALHSLDRNDKVIYMNTFTRTLAPSLRIAYLVLPRKLLARYSRELMFYACTVSEFEQMTLRSFLRGGYYERHLNRIRNIYKNRRDALLRILGTLPDIEINGKEAGLHLLISAKGRLTEQELIKLAGEHGVKVYGLSEYYLSAPAETHTVIMGYAGYDAEELKQAAGLLVQAWL